MSPALWAYSKGKSAIWVVRNWYGKQRNFGGEHFWARDFYVNTVGRDEEVIRAYIRDQEKRDQEEDRQLGLPFNCGYVPQPNGKSL